MQTNIAIIATNRKPKSCDDRNIIKLRYARQDSMQIINAEWIKQRLTGRRGEQAELARAIGVTPDVVSKILKGERRVQAHEIPKILAHFSELAPIEHDLTVQKLLQRIPELTGPERDLLLAAAEGMIAKRRAEDE